MKQIYTIRIAILFTLMVAGFAAKSQCPTGGFCNTGGTINSGQTLYISTAISAPVTLKNGAKMIIQSGGKFTGDISGNNGSKITIENGGEFSPGTANSFSSDVTNDGIINFNSIANFGTNFTLNNNTGKVTFLGSFNDNGKVTINNNACGSMVFNGSMNMQSKNSLLYNEGTLIVKGSLNTAMNTTLNNRGKFYTEGSFVSSGLIYNQNFMVFKGASNLNSGDSIVNLNVMVFYTSVLGGRDIRNEGLFWIASGSFQFNNGTIQQNTSGALFRLDGSLINSGVFNATGSFYVQSTIQNNGSIMGMSSTKKLNINKNVLSGTTNFLNVTQVVLFDSTNYAGYLKNAAICPMSTLPVTLSDLRGVHVNGDNKITWTSSSEVNALKYDILYSSNGTNYSTLGSVHANGTASSYQYFHFSPGYGVHYYRIRMLDKDGSAKLSNVIVLRVMDGNTEESAITVAGNPFKERVSLMIQSVKQEQVVIRLMDHSGKIVKQKMVMLEKGINNINVDQLAGLPTGTYILGLVQDGKIRSVKLVKS